MKDKEPVGDDPTVPQGLIDKLDSITADDIKVFHASIKLCIASLQHETFVVIRFVKCGLL
jgi:hypothetical protein